MENYKLSPESQEFIQEFNEMAKIAYPSKWYEQRKPAEKLVKFFKYLFFLLFVASAGAIIFDIFNIYIKVTIFIFSIIVGLVFYFLYKRIKRLQQAHYENGLQKYYEIREQKRKEGRG